MKKTQRFFALILCVILLLPILGCGQNKPRESKPLPSQTVQESAPAPESSKPSGPVYDTEPPVMESEEEQSDYSVTDPTYFIEPLKEPKNGAMTYEEFFSEERFEEVADRVLIENVPTEIAEGCDQKNYFYDIDDGYLLTLNQKEVWWYSHSFSEKELIYRAGGIETIGNFVVYENVATFDQYKIDGEYFTFRLYIPTYELEIAVPNEATPVNSPDGGKLSTTSYIVHDVRTAKGFLTYCTLNEMYYFVPSNDLMNGKDVWENMQIIKEKLNG